MVRQTLDNPHTNHARNNNPYSSLIQNDLRQPGLAENSLFPTNNVSTLPQTITGRQNKANSVQNDIPEKDMAAFTSAIAHITVLRAQLNQLQYDIQHMENEKEESIKQLAQKANPKYANAMQAQNLSTDVDQTAENRTSKALPNLTQTSPSQQEISSATALVQALIRGLVPA